MTDRPPYRACKVCGLMLSGYMPDGVDTAVDLIEWRHVASVGADHDPVPVPVDELEVPLKGVCDFDSTPDPPWLFLTRTDADDVLRWRPVGFIDDGMWAACDGCAALIRSGAWPLLVDRAAKAQARHTGVRARALKPAIEQLHGYFRQAYDQQPPRRIR